MYVHFKFVHEYFVTNNGKYYLEIGDNIVIGILEITLFSSFRFQYSV